MCVILAVVSLPALRALAGALGFRWLEGRGSSSGGWVVPVASGMIAGEGLAGILQGIMGVAGVTQGALTTAGCFGFPC